MFSIKLLATKVEHVHISQKLTIGELMKLMTLLSTSLLSFAVMAKPILIKVSGDQIESSKGTAYYQAIGDTHSAPNYCYVKTKEIEAKIIADEAGKDTIAKINLPMSVVGKCGIYTLKNVDMDMKLYDQNSFKFNIKSGKLLNDYSSGHATIIWGAKIAGTCSFRDSNLLGCMIANDFNTYKTPGKDRFTLFVSPLYTKFEWKFKVLDK